MYTVLPTHTADAGVALSSVGILLGVNRAVRILLNGPAGLAYDRCPRRWLFVPALFIGAASTAIYALTRGFWPLLLGRMLWGLAWSGIWVGGATVILDVTGDRDRGRWTGLYQTWFFLGGAAGAFAGGLLTDRVGYTTTMWIGALVTASGGLVTLFFLPETRNARLDVGSKPRPSIRLRHNRGLWIVASLQGANRFVASGVLAATLGLLVQGWLESISWAIGVATLTGAMAAGRAGLSMLAAPLAGAASDQLKNRWGVATGAMAVGVASMFLLTTNAAVTVLVGISLAAIVRGAAQAMVTALTGDLVGREQRGRAIGLVHTASDLGSGLGPPVAYALLPWIGLQGVYWVCAALLATEFCVIIWFRFQEMGWAQKTACSVPSVEQ
jgi:MFS family permease